METSPCAVGFQRRTTYAYYLAFIALGFVAGSLGPTIPGLARLIDEPNPETMGRFITLRTLGVTAGTLVLGWVVDRCASSIHLLLSASLVGMGFFMIVTPFASTSTSLAVIMIATGVCDAGVDVGVNTAITWLWPSSHVNGYMQVLHFAFGVGALVGPLVVAWGIRATGEVAVAFHLLGGFVVCVGVIFVAWFRKAPRSDAWTSAGASAAASLRQDVQDSRPLLPAAVRDATDATRARTSEDPSDQLVVEHQLPQQLVRDDPDDEMSAEPGHDGLGDADERDDEVFAQETASGVEHAMVASMGLFFLFYVGLEIGFGAWGAIFVVRSGVAGTDARHSEQAGAMLTSVFWASLTAARAAGAPLSRRFSATQMLQGDLCVCVLGAVILVLTGASSWPMLLLGTAMYGAAQGTIYPTTLVFPSSIGLRTRGSWIGRIMFGGNFGMFFVPWLIGLGMHHFGPLFLMISGLGFSLLCSVMFIAFHRLAWKLKANQDKLENKQQDGDELTVVA